MNIEELGRFIDRRYNQPGDTLRRVETLPKYDVGADGSDYDRWLTGATEPTWERKQPWLDELRRDYDHGMRQSRVRVFGAQLTDYELYACHFGYALNVAVGEDIRVLRDGEHTIPDGLYQHDYWLINDCFAIPMHYDLEGRFTRAVVAPDSSGYRDNWYRAWNAAEPFNQWWEKHPELHRHKAA